MQPVICFYENKKFIHSTDYQLISCSDEHDALFFLEQIEKDYADQMKVVKINFAALETPFSNDTCKTYVKTPKAQVFVLNSYELVTQKDLENLYPEKMTSRPAYYPTVRENVFLENVQSIKEDICRGRFYQMNYTAALEAEAPERHSLLSSFVHVSDVGGDYRAYLPLGHEEAIHCLSPELFLKKLGPKVITQPIKGTLLSGRALPELQNSRKENAELSMIVDLLRNDLNTLSCDKYNDSSRVNFHRQIMDLKYTAHTYSEVEINTSKKFSEIVARTFPGGSISGCPKKESLKKIAEIENYHRDFYTGSIGWWKGDDFCLNIAIRSSYQKKRQLYYFTGCGIVFDSEPRREWHEFLTKCSFLNLFIEYTPIVDTLAFSDGISYLPEHIERTFLAFRDQMVQIDKYQVQNLYQKIEQELREKIKTADTYKVRAIFNKNLTYRLEITLLEKKNDEVALQLIAFDKFLPQFKTTERSTWDNILKNKSAEADDVLVVNQQGRVVEASIYSVFYKKDGEFFTPPISDGGMYSVYRAHHIKKGSITLDDRTFKLSERSLPTSELESVELYVANSVRGLKKASLLF
ncbi:bifunctional chorismate-binding protein/class IV aminotransferase [Pseudobdellovibrio sp. HCB154]|uniref:bifunctional chorismate-binding protein/class IV aminotransferase n=1 Tax=Pseudobdellovibrio sp. HCB154 TaxID=3386277 RepID=UPI00391747C3